MAIGNTTYHSTVNGETELEQSSSEPQGSYIYYTSRYANETLCNPWCLYGDV